MSILDRIIKASGDKREAAESLIHEILDMAADIDSEYCVHSSEKIRLGRCLNFRPDDMDTFKALERLLKD